MLVPIKRVLVSAIVLVTGGSASGCASLHRGADPQGTLSTATADRGDVVVTVGGVGRIVEARASGPLALPAPAGGSPGASAAATTPAGAVFPRASGRIVRFLVQPGEDVSAGDPIAVLDDGDASATAIALAHTDVATARLELAQKETSDPAKGLPPTAAELRAARLALRSAHERANLIEHPSAADVTSARVDFRRARADLATLARRPDPGALAAARLALDLATQRLAQTTEQAAPLDIAAAKLELAKAQADIDALKAMPPGTSAAAVQAAQLAVTLAQQRLAELPSGSMPSELTAAQLDLAKARAELETLQRPLVGPGASALGAAQAAVGLASEKLALLAGAPNRLAVVAAELERQKAQADLELLQRSGARRSLEAGRLAVKLARQRLGQLLHPTAATRDAGRADLAKASADLESLVRRGSPGNPSDIAIARLKLRAATAHLATLRLQAGRLTVRTVFGGTLTALLTAPGAPADTSTPIATVADLHHLAVSVDLSEFDIAAVRRGAPAILAVDALGGRKLPGRVSFVAPTGVESGGIVSFPVRVALTRASAVKPGMNVSVRIVVARRQNVLRVPLEAVSDDKVTVVAPNGKTITRAVKVGLTDNKVVEIRSGLHSGERVLLAANGG